MFFLSRLVNSYKVLDLDPANGALLQVFTAFDASRIVFAWHIHAIFILFTTDHAGIRMCLLTN